MGTIKKQIKEFVDEWYNKEDYIIAHTSGSTGAPKEIRLPKQLVEQSALRTNKFFNIDRSSHLHLCLSPQYIAGKMMIVRSIISGAYLSYEQPSSSPLLTMSDSDIDFIAVVGTQLPQLLKNVRNSIGKTKVHKVLIGGSPMNHEMRQCALLGHWESYESYGMTETASHIAIRKVSSNPDLPFNTLPGITVSLDARNCLTISLPGIAPIITNDVAEIISPTSFLIHGRIDNVIISGGIKIHPEEVEKSINSLMQPLGRFYISSQASNKWGQEVVLVIECNQPSPHDVRCLIEQLSLILPNHQVPKRVIFKEKFLTTASGKIIREKF